ncbi:MAG: hypothetical protein ACOCZS_03910, partial [Verrucomicrobiota bacterium]
DGGPGSDGTMEIQLVCSRDLIHWERLGERRPFLPLGEVGAWDQSMVTPFKSNHIVRDGRMQLYHGGLRHSHEHMSRWNKPGDWPGEMGGIGLASLRQDGFVSLDTDTSGGQLMTRLLCMRGKQLQINAEAENGEITVALFDSDGSVLPGYGHEDCLKLQGNGTAQTVHWKNGDDLTSLQNCGLRLEFHLRNAKLYGFQFS